MNEVPAPAFAGVGYKVNERIDLFFTTTIELSYSTPMLSEMLSPSTLEHPRRVLSRIRRLTAVFGAPDRIRTCDLCLRRAALYPAELRVLSALNLVKAPPLSNAATALGETMIGPLTLL